MMNQWRSASRLARIALAGGMLVVSGQAWAEGEEPPAAYVRLAQPSAANLGPATPSSFLYTQVNAVNEGGVVSNNYETAYDGFDSRGADDFAIPSSVVIWEISAVEVHGQYAHGSQASVDSVNLQFYAIGSGNLPGQLIYNADIMPAGDPTAGLFVLNLPSAINLPGGYVFWVSAQANKAYLSGQWLWFEFLGQNYNPSAWQNPGGRYGTPCSAWGARVATCGLGEYPDTDMAFRLVGEAYDSSTYDHKLFLPAVFGP